MDNTNEKKTNKINDRREQSKFSSGDKKYSRGNNKNNARRFNEKAGGIRADGNAGSERLPRYAPAE